MANSAEIIDPLLWRDAQRLLRRHYAAADQDRCAWCETAWPCEARRLAERAIEVSARAPSATSTAP